MIRLNVMTLVALAFLSVSLSGAMLAGNLSAADGPKVQRVLPVGGMIGKTHEVVLTGTFPAWPVKVWTDSADLTIQPLEASGKLSIIVSADAKPGVRYFRVYDANGASGLLPFIVDQCGDALEAEPNDHYNKAQPVEKLPIAMHGCLEKNGDVDTFQVNLTQGQTLVASLDGQRYLNSPMDADLQVLTARGVVLAQQMDHHGLDPELHFTAPSDGVYLIRVLAFPDTPNSTIAYAGGEKFVYRLMLTHSAYLQRTVPACLSNHRENTLQLFGANLVGEGKSVTLPAITTAVDRTNFSLPGMQGFLALPVTADAIFVEAEPNSSKQPQLIEVPSITTGMIDAAKDQDAFVFSSPASKRWRIAVDAKSIGSSLDAVLTVSNSEGKQLATNDDVGESRDPSLSFVAPAEGKFTVAVHDMYREGGHKHWYRLSIEPEAADYSISVASDVFVGKVNQPIEITVTVARTLDYAGEITIAPENELTPGVRPQVLSKKGDDSAKSVKLTIQSSAAYSGPIRIVGTSDLPQKHFAKPAKAASDWLWLTITE